MAEFLPPIRSACVIEPLSLEVHDKASSLTKRYGLNVHDAMVAASALAAECATLLTEDMQHGLVIDHRLQLVNPFR